MELIISTMRNQSTQTTEEHLVNPCYTGGYSHVEHVCEVVLDLMQTGCTMKKRVEKLQAETELIAITP